MELTDSIEIERPPAQVWAWLTDHERKKQWLKGLLGEEWVQGEKGATGSRFRIRVKEGPRVTPYEGVVLEAEEPRIMRSSVTGGCGKKPMTMEVEYRLTDLGGRTRVDHRCSAMMEAGAFMRMLMPLFGWFARRQTRSFHRNLKNLAEGEAASPSSVAAAGPD